MNCIFKIFPLFHTIPVHFTSHVTHELPIELVDVIIKLYQLATTVANANRRKTQLSMMATKKQHTK